MKQNLAQHGSHVYITCSMCRVPGTCLTGPGTPASVLLWTCWCAFVWRLVPFDGHVLFPTSLNPRLEPAD